MKRLVSASLAAVLMMPAAPVLAQRDNQRHDHRNGRVYHYDGGVRYWNGRDGRRYCRKPDGTVGLLIGGAAGALVGRAIDGGRDRTTGTIVGAAGGALLGREVARGRARCR